MQENHAVVRAVITYNSFESFTDFPEYEKGINKIKSKSVLLLPNCFNPKSPISVRSDDTQWKTLMRHYDTLEKVIIFAGKKSSGSLEIIKLAVQTFRDKKHILEFILCDHDLEEKKLLLTELGITPTQYSVFIDGFEICRETKHLIGPMLCGL